MPLVEKIGEDKAVIPDHLTSLTIKELKPSTKLLDRYLKVKVQQKWQLSTRGPGSIKLTLVDGDGTVIDFLGVGKIAYDLDSVTCGETLILIRFVCQRATSDYKKPYLIIADDTKLEKSLVWICKSGAAAVVYKQGDKPADSKVAFNNNLEKPSSGSRAEVVQTNGSVAGNKEVVETSGSVAINKEVDKPTSPAFRNKEVVQTNGSLARNKEVVETSGSVVENKEVVETSGSVAINKEVDKPTSPASRNKEVVQTNGSSARNTEVDKQTSPAARNKEVVQANGSAARNKEVVQTNGSAATNKEVVETSGSVVENKEVVETSGSVAINKEVDKPTSPASRNKEVVQTNGSAARNKEVDIQTSSAARNKEVVQTNGSAATNKEVVETSGSVFGNKEVVETSGSVAINKEVDKPTSPASRNKQLPKKSPQYTYKLLSDLEVNTVVDVYGVVKFSRPAMKTRGQDYLCVVGLVDPSLTEPESKLPCNLFCRDADKLPAPETGDVIRFHRLRIQTFNGRLQGSNAPGFQWLLFQGSCDKRTSSSPNYTFEEQDQQKVSQLMDWWNELNKLTLTPLAEMQPKLYYNLVCQVIRVCELESNCVLLRVWDGTHFNWPVKTTKEEELNGSLKEDARLVKASEGLAYDIYVFDCHCQSAAVVEPGDFVQFINLHAAVYTEPVELTLHGNVSFGRKVAVLPPDSCDVVKLKAVLDPLVEQSDRPVQEENDPNGRSGRKRHRSLSLLKEEISSPNKKQARDTNSNACESSQTLSKSLPGTSPHSLTEPRNSSAAFEKQCTIEQNTSCANTSKERALISSHSLTEPRNSSAAFEKQSTIKQTTLISSHSNAAETETNPTSHVSKEHVIEVCCEEGFRNMPAKQSKCLPPFTASQLSPSTASHRDLSQTVVHPNNIGQCCPKHQEKDLIKLSASPVMHYEIIHSLNPVGSESCTICKTSNTREGLTFSDNSVSDSLDSPSSYHTAPSPGSCGMKPGSCDMEPGSCDMEPGSCDMEPGSCDMEASSDQNLPSHDHTSSRHDQTSSNYKVVQKNPLVLKSKGQNQEEKNPSSLLPRCSEGEGHIICHDTYTIYYVSSQDSMPDSSEKSQDSDISDNLFSGCAKKAVVRDHLTRNCSQPAVSKKSLSHLTEPTVSDKLVSCCSQQSVNCDTSSDCGTKLTAADTSDSQCMRPNSNNGRTISGQKKLVVHKKLLLNPAIKKQLRCMLKTSTVTVGHHLVPFTTLSEVLQHNEPSKFRLQVRVQDFLPKPSCCHALIFLSCRHCLHSENCQDLTHTENQICCQCNNKNTLSPTVMMTFTLFDDTGTIVAHLVDKYSLQFFQLNSSLELTDKPTFTRVVQSLNTLCPDGLSPEMFPLMECCIMAFKDNGSMRFHIFDTILV
ncbi:protection of telomeres protein 1 [Biomphalaria pfeifferi]|uniref:Protection of telomeres protein 1 n=1 Tax=Biomphalaria pfeifferi TaxID=112525 RepID=A0AAD8EVQ5_BIOPF|nr:protection of telomeres protein 1 [Biomphalaria pfeifferi]